MMRCICTDFSINSPSWRKRRRTKRIWKIWPRRQSATENHNVPNDPSFKRFCDIFLSAVIVIKYVSTKCQIISCFCGTARHTSTVYRSDHNAAAVHYPSRRGCLAAQYALYHHVLLQKHLLTKLKLSCGSTMFSKRFYYDLIHHHKNCPHAARRFPAFFLHFLQMWEIQLFFCT